MRVAGGAVGTERLLPSRAELVRVQYHIAWDGKCDRFPDTGIHSTLM
eukprot:COSAG02_NODE_83_length_39665_cov_25.213719_7_plen_47_part_00